MSAPLTDAQACGCCGQQAYATNVFHYLETWGQDYCAGDPMGSSLRKRRLLCAKCGEAALKAVVPASVTVRQDVGIEAAESHETDPDSERMAEESDPQELCECGHKRERHSDMGCLAATDESKPIGQKDYCPCLAYAKAGTPT